MADLLSALAAGVGLSMVAGLLWLAVASAVDDHLRDRETREIERDTDEFIDDLERVHGRAFRAQE